MILKNIHSRRILALTLSLALALIAGSSLWHHDHGQALVHHAPADSRMAAPAAEADHADYCPICLSQRLLSHSWIQVANEAAIPTPIAHIPERPAVLPTGGSHNSPEARAPPC
jgi:hypothetical protein